MIYAFLTVIFLVMLLGSIHHINKAHQEGLHEGIAIGAQGTVNYLHAKGHLNEQEVKEILVYIDEVKT